jgi:hypothetical protein
MKVLVYKVKSIRTSESILKGMGNVFEVLYNEGLDGMKREKLSTTEGGMAEEYKRAWKGMFVGREVRYREAWTSSMSGLSIIRSSWPFCIRVSDYSSPTERD